VIGVIDACFIIDWSRYRHRDLIKGLFDILYIHEEILAQLRSEISISFTSRLLAEGKLRLYPWTQSDEDEFLLLRSEIIANPRIPSLERPDLLCLIIARRANAILLSENIGIHRVIEFHPRYRNVKVWTALETLEHLVYRGLITLSSEEEFMRFVREYEQDTNHIFRKRRIETCLKRLRTWLRR